MTAPQGKHREGADVLRTFRLQQGPQAVMRNGASVGWWMAVVLWVVSIAGITLPVVGVVRADGDEQDPAWEALMAAHRQFQQELFDLMVSRWPDLRSALEGSRDLQLALRDLRTLQFYHTLKRHPERIVRHRGIAAFEHGFIAAWTEKDAKQLRRRHPEVAALEQRIDTLRQAHSQHPMWPQVRETFQLFQQEAAYQQALRRLQDEVAKAQTQLNWQVEQTSLKPKRKKQR